MAGVGVARCLAALTAAWVVCGIALAGAAQAQGQDDLALLRAEVLRLSGLSKYAQALPIAQRYVELTSQKHGENHPAFAEAVTLLGSISWAQGRFAEAERLHKRSLAIFETTLGREHPNVATVLNGLAGIYWSQRRYTEAEPLAKRSLAIFERTFGREHPDVALPLAMLAKLYQGQGRYVDAEPLFRRSLAIYETTYGREHRNVAASLNDLARLYRDQGRYVDAEPLYKRSLAIHETARGTEDPAVAVALSTLAELYHAQGRYVDAEPLYKRSLAIHEKTFGREHPNVASVLNLLANLYWVQGRYVDAEPVAKRSLAIYEATFGREHANVAAVLNILAPLYWAQGRLADAERLHKRSLAILETTLGREHPDVATALNNLAEFYQTQGRYADAEPLYKRSLTIYETVLGHQHPLVATAVINLALTYQASGRYADAEPFYRRGLAIVETALGREHPNVATALTYLAALYAADGRYADAEPLYKRSLAIVETALGRDHPNAATALSGLGLLYQRQSRYADAEPLYKRSLAIVETALGRDHPYAVTALGSLAWLAVVRNNWTGAADSLRRSTSIVRRRTERGVAASRGDGPGGEAQRPRWHFQGLVAIGHRLAAQDGDSARGALAREMFETAQWAQASEAATSLTQMAARSASGSPELAALVRERQDLVGEWQARDKLLLAARSLEPAKRNADVEKALAGRLAAIDGRLAQINQRLAQGFPDYAALASPAPVSVADVQAQVGADEALVLFLDMDDRFKPLPEETFVWVVTRSQVRWVRSELGTAALAREVAALRCGLDWAMWNNAAGAKRCSEQAQPKRNVLPFDVGRAHALYKALLGGVEDLIAGKHLLIVPSGPLTQLPFQVLVTEVPKAAMPEEVAGYRETAWLAARQPITVLPAVSSLKALRAHAKASRAGKVYLGIGNPLLDGPDAGYAEPARLAREKQRCLEALPQWRVVVRVAAPAGIERVQSRAGLADLAHLRMQAPLPETADELCAVAQDLKADASEVRLGNRATETEIKRLSTSGELARYRVIHFATHGAMAGELDKDREPGLILTPPDTASEEDDGYLSASEIAGLKLDADWVILSACNTAAGGASSAEALSGIARAFLYAGARALLVSHWAVESNTAVKLITTATAEMARDASVGRAEAMRRATLALIAKGRPEEAHPAYWGPFVVVGEGAAGR